MTEEPINRTILGNFINWGYKEMSWFFTVCRFSFKLDQIRFVYDHPDMEYGSLHKINNQEIITAMSFPPLAFSELIISQTSDLKGISLQALTFNGDKTYELLCDMAKGTSWIQGDPRPEIKTLEPTVLGNIRALYHPTKELSLRNNIDMGVIFGMTRYRRFLINDREVPESESMPLVLERFGIKAE
jgi:hypothetical protein